MKYILIICIFALTSCAYSRPIQIEGELCKRISTSEYIFTQTLGTVHGMVIKYRTDNSVALCTVRD